VLEHQGDVHVSLSHTQGAVAAAAAYHPIGIDIERVRPIRGLDGLASMVLAPGERRMLDSACDPVSTLLCLWTRKEALIKAGFTSMAHLRNVDLSLGTPIGEAWKGWHLEGSDPVQPHGHDAVVVALAGRRPIAAACVAPMIVRIPPD
jgi:phosphopantetheinyl transferase (holo-ACP synthase)